MTDSADAKEGLSKKELNKLARKEKRTGGSAAPAEPSVPSIGVVTFSKLVSPELSHAVQVFTKQVGIVKFTINKTKEQLPSLALNDGLDGTVNGDAAIARYLLRTSESDVASALYPLSDAWRASQVDQWLDIYSLATTSDTFLASVSALIDDYVLDKTYLVGESLTLADIAAVLLLVKKLKFQPEGSAHVNLARWFNLVSKEVVPHLTAIPVTFVPVVNKDAGKKEAAEATGAAPTSSGKAVKEAASAAPAANSGNSAVEDGATCPPLEGAVEGQVCTRFPPEPSGYLHIGHAKAVLLNQYYAQRYKGKLLVRFDDTNPSKEKEEFEENIIQDLATLGVVADKVSHSSDHFAVAEEYARKMIKEGKAYMDDTDQETMQAERMERKESKRRNTSPEENLKVFEALLRGDVDARPYCLRAKIDMNSVNGTMRDPVLYRYNDTPHHRTGTKFKAYPTYDFICPLVDAIEGVTHALRTTEYNDRDEQYYWLQNAMGLRSVSIMSYGKLNFVHTVLSKRKLTWFVDNKLVEGWFDPRFPTIQGCVRRGMNVEALKNFIISQGASRRIITMEWDKFWAENKKVLEEKAPRYMGVSVPDQVEVVIDNVPAVVTAHSVQIHPQKPELGTRVMRRSNRLLIDQIDAVTYSVGEEVTFLRWGNMKINEIVRETQADGTPGKIVTLKVSYNAEATNFAKTKKATWIANVEELVPCKVFEFDHLISKAKLEEEDKFQDHINPVSKIESAALGDPCLRTVAAGDVIQLERKGFFRCDKPFGGSADKPLVLFAIPDGRAKGVAVTAAAAAAPSKKKK